MFLGALFCCLSPPQPLREAAGCKQQKKNKTFTEWKSSKALIVHWALLSLHNDEMKSWKKHTTGTLSFFAASLWKPNNACKKKPLWLLSASSIGNEPATGIKGHWISPWLAFNQVSDQQQTTHHYLFNFHRLNYLELCSFVELCTATN